MVYANKTKGNSMTIVEQIINGDHDAELQSIVEAVRERKKLNRSKNTAIAMVSMKVGDIVVLKNLSPKYVNGLKAKIVEKKRTKFAVTLVDGSVGRFSGRVTVPASCMEKV